MLLWTQIKEELWHETKYLNACLTLLKLDINWKEGWGQVNAGHLYASTPTTFLTDFDLLCNKAGGL